MYYRISEYCLAAFLVLFFISTVSAVGINNPNLPLVKTEKAAQVSSSVNYTEINVNNSQFLEGHPANYFYEASNPLGFISSYTETDPSWTKNLTDGLSMDLNFKDGDGNYHVIRNITELYDDGDSGLWLFVDSFYVDANLDLQSHYIQGVTEIMGEPYVTFGSDSTEHGLSNYYDVLISGDTEFHGKAYFDYNELCNNTACWTFQELNATGDGNQSLNETYLNNKYVKRIGDNMTGDLNMSGNDITGVTELRVKDIYTSYSTNPNYVWNIYGANGGELKFALPEAGGTVLQIQALGTEISSFAHWIMNGYDIVDVLSIDGSGEPVQFDHRTSGHGLTDEGDIIINNLEVQGNQFIDGVLCNSSEACFTLSELNGSVTGEGDNLGNHIATQNLNMMENNITNMTNICNSSDYCYDINSLGGVGDNLGNHIATQNLDMSGDNITKVSIIFGNGSYVRIGDAITTQFALSNEDDLMVSGKLEAYGASYFGDAATFKRGITIRNYNGIYSLGILTGIVNSGLALNVGDYSKKNFILNYYSSIVDYGHNLLSPSATMWWQSDTPPATDSTQWGAIRRNNTQFEIASPDGIDFIIANDTSNWVNKGYEISRPLKVRNNSIIISSNKTSAICDSDNEGAIYYDGNAHKHYGCDGTTWNAFY